MARTVATKQVNELRDGHYILNPVTSLYERSTLLELARTNICLQSETFDNATWTPTRASVSANGDTAPDGAATADRLIEDATATSTHFTEQSFTITANATVSLSVFAKAGTRSWLRLELRDTGAANRSYVYFNLATGVAGTSVTAGTGTVVRTDVFALSNGWYRCTLTGTLGGGITAAKIVLALASADNTQTYSGDGASYIALWGAQVADASPFPTSYIPTTTAAVTRAVDTFSYPVPTGMTTPAAFTAYLKFIERGTSLVSSGRLLQISESGDNNNALILLEGTAFGGAGKYVGTLFDSGGAATSSSVAGAAPAYGDLVELRVTVSAAGVAQIHQSINAGTETSATAGAAGGLPAQWGTGTAKLWLGSRNGFAAGAVALMAVKMARGSQSLAAMRAFA